MTLWSYPIRGGDYAAGGAAARQLKELVKTLGGVDPLAVRRLMIAAYEAEMNVVIHARRGVLEARFDDGEVAVEVRDEGPGIPDLALALRAGYSTAPAEARALGFGAGLGLPNIRKQSDAFALESTVGAGTCVRFTVRLAARAGNERRATSLRVQAERCQRCLRCLTACPTQALRVHRGGPLVLAHLCIECTACVAACPTGALGLEAAAALPPPAARALVLPPAVLAQFGSAIPPAGVVAALRALGFGEVRTTGAWERAQAEATAAAASSAPLLAALCPAVVSLVETRFPSLLEALAPYLTPLEAAAVDAPADALIVCVCPAQRSALVALGLAPERLLAPQALRDALLAELHAPPPAGAAPLAAPVPAPAPAATAGLPVHGLAAVRRTLEELEDGQLTFGGALELWACPYGCFGSGLLPAANPAVAAARWRDDAAAAPAPRRRAVPYSARPGLRLDPDMAAAVAKLRRIDELTRALPGRDCGQCGAPTCRALAEDVVLERAPASACAHQAAAAERSA